VVLADHTKIGRTALSPVACLKVVHILVTDDQTDPSILAEFRKGGIEIIVAAG
jgi:DeoR/GlpR family transcriptional regulator of sugar metabolism